MLITLNKIAADIGLESVDDSSLVINSPIAVVFGRYFARVISVGDGFTVGAEIIYVAIAVGFP